MIFNLFLCNIVKPLFNKNYLCKKKEKKVSVVLFARCIEAWEAIWLGLSNLISPLQASKHNKIILKTCINCFKALKCIFIHLRNWKNKKKSNKRNLIIFPGLDLFFFVLLGCCNHHQQNGLLRKKGTLDTIIAGCIVRI
jgi:hypothetical protein